MAGFPIFIAQRSVEVFIPQSCEKFYVLVQLGSVPHGKSQVCGFPRFRIPGSVSTIVIGGVVNLLVITYFVVPAANNSTKHAFYIKGMEQETAVIIHYQKLPSTTVAFIIILTGTPWDVTGRGRCS